MQAYPHRRAGQTLTAAALAAVLYGCGASSDAHREPTPAGAVGPAGIDVVATTVDSRPVALIDGRSLAWGEMRPLLSEAAGAEVLQEITLNRLLSRAIEERGITIGPDEIAGERALLLQALDPDLNKAVMLLRELRNHERLGSNRFTLLMRRNAALRALVRDQVRITDETIQQMHELAHGPKRQVRLITVPTLADAQRIIDQARGGDAFHDLAVARSTDASASRGGLLEPVSRADPSYPRALRDAIWSLAPSPGALSPPVLLDRGYAVVELVREEQGDGTALEDVRPELERLARLNQERVLMDQLARRMMTGVSITIFDEPLSESWKLWKQTQ